MQTAHVLSTNATAAKILAFWQEAGPDRWFSQSDSFDDEFRDRFLTLHERASAGRLESWSSDPGSALALVLLLDQFPRNCFRGTPRMYESDALARLYADVALQAGFDEEVDAALRVFFYLPFEHSEHLSDQRRSLALHEQLGFTRYAEHHLHIIQRFGRFPHRNAILGRTNTPEEQSFLDTGGFAG